MSHGRWLTPTQKQGIWLDLSQGFSMAATARKRGVSYSTVKLVKASMVTKKMPTLHEPQAALPPPLHRNELCEEAQRALEDFDFFRRRYFGHISTPWQVETANLFVRLLATPTKEYVVENCPPGVGKSTLVHDIAAWAICRNRRVRGLFGSRTSANAERQLMRLRRSLERTIPVQARGDLVDRGLACDAQSTLALDFGRFKPDGGEVWRAESFVVLQDDDTAIEEKEPTWSAYGVDQGILGNRFECILWDDLVDRRNIRNIEAAEFLRKLWDEELETRLEPGGLLVLVGQRMAADDLYRYCLSKKAPTEDGEAGAIPMYDHVIYPAHDERKCELVHGLDATPQPEGCLLDPYRLPWRELRQIASNSPERYRVLYQQEDVDPASVLVDPVWVSGGVDREGVQCPGCWDLDRGAGEIPPGLTDPFISIATADPSPTRYWAVQWWIYHPATEQRILIDTLARRMDAPDFLDFNYATGNFTGVMEEWQARSRTLGAPIRYWVVEDNAAQRFLLQYDHVRRWTAMRGVNLIPHQTHRNKSDPALGVTSIAPHWRYGRVRLPGSHRKGGREVALKLVDEVTRWPSASKDDQVMANWFLEWNIPRIHSPLRDNPPQIWRPSWMRKQYAGVRG